MSNGFIYICEINIEKVEQLSYHLKSLKMIEDTSVDFPQIPQENEDYEELPERDPFHSLIGYRKLEATFFYRPLYYVWYHLEDYGWYLLGVLIATLYLYHKLRPVYYQWKQAREDAAYHKDPDRILQHIEGTQRAREIQQQVLLQESQRAAHTNRQSEERIRMERAQFLDRLENGTGSAWKKHKVDNYLPLRGGASVSTYRQQKRSPCGDGGCGR